MSSPRFQSVLALAAILAATTGAAVQNLNWQQRGPGIAGYPTPQLFNGILYTTSTLPSGPSQMWSSADTGKSWSLAWTETGVIKGIQAVKVNGEQLLFRAVQRSNAEKFTLIRRDAKSETIVLDSIGSVYGVPLLAQVGEALLVRTLSSLRRSTDGGLHWTAVEPCLGTQIDRSAGCTATPDYWTESFTPLWGNGPRLIAVSEYSLFASTDSGRAWTKLTGDVASHLPNLGDMSADGETLVLTNNFGAPTRIRFQGQSWSQDTLTGGWPRDSAGLGARANSVQYLRDTLWATAGAALYHWQPATNRWAFYEFGSMNLGQSAWIKVIADNLWLFSDAAIRFRTADGQTAALPGLPTKDRTGVTALAWYDAKLFACGWNGCAQSSDSGTNWTSVNLGLEGTYVSYLEASSRGLMAATSDFGLRKWDGKTWTAMASGLSSTSNSGRYPWIMNFATNQDTTLVSGIWDSGVWLQKGAAAPWSRTSEATIEMSAWAEGGFWLGCSDTLLFSKDGQTWTKIKAPFYGCPHNVGGKLLLTQSWGSRLAWKEGDDFRVDSSVGDAAYPITRGADGAIVAAHPSGTLVLNAQGVSLYSNAERVDMPIPDDPAPPWIGAVILVGNRVFAARERGLWTASLPAGVGIHPRSVRDQQVRLVPRGLEVELPQPAHVELQWFDVSGARKGRLVRDLLAGKNALCLPKTVHGSKILRLVVDGVPLATRLLAVP